MNDIIKTQHFSDDCELIENLIHFIPQDVLLVEPFAGSGSLTKNFTNNSWELYDIEPQRVDIEQRDTLLNPPSYINKWVITNPPYLAKNKASNLEIFHHYPKYDDLYKIAIHTLLEAEGGILIVPINFFADERSKTIREEFFKHFSILQLNLFTTQMFEKTAYNVCSFAFIKTTEQTKEVQIPLTIFPQKQNSILTLSEKGNWRIGGEILVQLMKCKNIFSRLTIANPTPKGYITHITINCIDKVNEPLHFYFSDEPYYGIETDRMLASFVSCIELDLDMQKQIIDVANELITDYRQECYNMCFTNYRDKNRKRIGFKEAYAFASLAYTKIINMTD